MRWARASADAWELGAFLIPGQVAGAALADLAGAALVARWERRRGARVLARGDVLYAA